MKYNKKSLIYFILFLLYLQNNLFAQRIVEKDFSLTQFYYHEGSIDLEHSNDGLNNGLEENLLQIHAPFYSDEIQIFALQSQLATKTLLGDQNLQAQLGLAWKFLFTENWNLVAGLNGNFTQIDINKNLSTLNNTDELLRYQQFNTVGANISLGILQQYFWIITSYNQTFSSKNQYKNYEEQCLNSSLGGKYNFKDWEWKLTLQAYDLTHFETEQIYGGFQVAYKKNYIYACSNIDGNMQFEFGLKPYYWLNIGFFYGLNYSSNTSSYGALGTYHWKAKKLKL